MTKPVFLKSAKTLVLSTIHVLGMQSAELLITGQCASVLKDGPEIQKFAATNVRAYIYSISMMMRSFGVFDDSLNECSFYFSGMYPRQ